LLLWCDNRRDTFLVSAPDERELGQVVAALRRSFRGQRLLAEGADAIVIIPEFEWREPPTVTGLARRSGVWVLHPVIYFEGKETYRLVAPSKRELHRFVERVRDLGDVEILSVTERSGLAEVRDAPAASIHLLEGLTNRQARSMVAAYDGGLLAVPARARWGDIARREGLSRSTFGEHLRKGQLRLLANSYFALRARVERNVLLPEEERGPRPPLTPRRVGRARTRRAP